MIFSLPFLVITFCVYGFIPELRNLHGKSLMCYVFGLTILYISLSVVQLEGESFLPESFLCVFCGYMMYVSILLCFFWLNVMCYDIWSTFRGMRGRGSDKRRFMLYCLYAFGVPLLLTGLVYLIDLTRFIPKEFRPQMGQNRCWLQNNRLVEAIYTYIPISIILTVNVALYSITAYKIYQVQKETSVIRNGDSQKHSRDAEKDR
jgi:G protein-coupled receptor Mth (Methuselah protein)